jgi:hypothetical protein
MALVCPAQTSLLDSDLLATYSSDKPGILPATASSDRDGKGLMTSDAMKTAIDSLKRSGIVPVASTDQADIYMEKQKTFFKNVQAEYCFYDARYKYALDKLFNAVRQGYQTNTADTQGTIQKYLKLTQTMNRKMNDLSQLINGISADMMLVTSQMEEEIIAFNKKIQDLKMKLQDQNKIISSNEASMKIKKEMVKFTEEKARNSDNMLNLYGFLNIVTLGLLVYIYKAAD